MLGKISQKWTMSAIASKYFITWTICEPSHAFDSSFLLSFQLLISNCLLKICPSFKTTRSFRKLTQSYSEKLWLAQIMKHWILQCLWYVGSQISYIGYIIWRYTFLCFGCNNLAIIISSLLLCVNIFLYKI